LLVLSFISAKQDEEEQNEKEDERAVRREREGEKDKTHCTHTHRDRNVPRFDWPKKKRNYNHKQGLFKR
jgi:hypothetical protein